MSIYIKNKNSRIPRDMKRIKVPLELASDFPLLKEEVKNERGLTYANPVSTEAVVTPNLLVKMKMCWDIYEETHDMGALAIEIHHQFDDKFLLRNAVEAMKELGHPIEPAMRRELEIVEASELGLSGRAARPATAVVSESEPADVSRKAVSGSEPADGSVGWIRAPADRGWEAETSSRIQDLRIFWSKQCVMFVFSCFSCFQFVCLE